MQRTAFQPWKRQPAVIPPDTDFKFHTTSLEAFGYFFIITGNQIKFYLNKLNIKEIYLQKLNPSSNIREFTEKIYKHDETDGELSMIFLIRINTE